MTKHEVMVAGDALMDMQYFVEALPEKGGDERIIEKRISTGGAAANTAYTLAKLGAETAFLGCMGQDDFADQISEQLRKAGVDVSLVQYGGQTGYTLDLIEKSGERTMLSFRGASARPIELSRAVKSRLGKTAVFLVSGYLLTDTKQADFVLAAAAHVKVSGGLTALDPCPIVDRVPDRVLAEMLQTTDILLPNERELGIIRQRFAEAAAKIPCIALKRGAAGASIMLQKGFVPPLGKGEQADSTAEAGVRPLRAVDTTGAGDAFNAGLIAAMLKGGEPEAWLAAGNRAAGDCILSPGAVNADIAEQV